MKTLRNILIGIVILGTVLVVLNLNIKKKSNAIYPCNPNQITLLSIKNSKDTFVIDRSLNTPQELTSWTLKEPQTSIMSEADSKLVMIYLTSLCQLMPVETFQVSQADDLKNYGLLESKQQITIRTDQLVTLSLGSETPSGTEYYINLSTQPTHVYTIHNQKFSHLLPTATELKSRSLLAKTILNSTSKDIFTLTSDAFDYTFSCSEGKCQEINNKIPATKSQNIMEALKGVLFTNYHGPLSKEEASQYGVSIPDIVFKHIDKATGEPIGQEWKFSFLDNIYLSSQTQSGDFLVYILEPEAPIALLKLLKS